MEEEKHKKPLLSYEEVIEVIDERISRDEPATADERIQTCRGSGETNGRRNVKRISCRKKVSRLFSEILDKSGPIHQKVFR